MKEITVGSEWKSIYEVHRGDLIRVEGVDSRTVHILWVNTGHRKAWPVDSFLTHFVEYDKPDVLPVEGASIAEALEAVVVLAKHSDGFDDQIDCIRSALERAAAEGEGLKDYLHATALELEKFMKLKASYEASWRAECERPAIRAEQACPFWEMSPSERADLAAHLQPLPAPPKGSTP